MPEHDEFRESLARLGLSQYFDRLVAEAFESWEVLLDITESDLDALGVKRGHRRVLQRAIAEYQRETTASIANDILQADQDGDSVLHAEATHGRHAIASSQPPGGKRKYRRHPKPDTHAPERPPSAYVLFSNNVRIELKDQELSFTDIAKTVGERWQQLHPEERGIYESKSQAFKDRYYSLLFDYKKTQHYEDYQEYLAEFKAKHDQLPTDGERKRSRMESTQTMVDGSSNKSRTDSDCESKPLSRVSIGDWTDGERKGSFDSSPTTSIKSVAGWRTTVSILDRQSSSASSTDVRGYPQTGEPVECTGSTLPARPMENSRRFQKESTIGALSSVQRSASTTGLPSTLEPLVLGPTGAPLALHATHRDTSVKGDDSTRVVNLRPLSLPHDRAFTTNEQSGWGKLPGYSARGSHAHDAMEVSISPEMSYRQLPPLMTSKSTHSRTGQHVIQAHTQGYSARSDLATLLHVGKQLALSDAERSPV